eukprot:COSAG01_NODE_1401_length_10450_cov_100.148198_11_plen_234_part_00
MMTTACCCQKVAITMSLMDPTHTQAFAQRSGSTHGSLHKTQFIMRTKFRHGLDWPEKFSGGVLKVDQAVESPDLRDVLGNEHVRMQVSRRPHWCLLPVEFLEVASHEGHRRADALECHVLKYPHTTAVKERHALAPGLHLVQWKHVCVLPRRCDGRPHQPAQPVLQRHQRRRPAPPASAARLIERRAEEPCRSDQAGARGRVHARRIDVVELDPDRVPSTFRFPLRLRLRLRR